MSSANRRFGPASFGDEPPPIPLSAVAHTILDHVTTLANVLESLRLKLDDHPDLEPGLEVARRQLAGLTKLAETLREGADSGPDLR